MNKFFSKKVLKFLILTLFTSCLSLPQSAQAADLFSSYYDLKQRAISYQNEVKPILDTRCVVCHACYDSPCQLKLGSIQGIDRGATKQVVYDGGRLSPVSPTRLFIDADSTEGWRQKQFYPVINNTTRTSQLNLTHSLMAQFIKLKHKHPLSNTGKLSNSFDFDLNRKLECPDQSEFNQFQKKHPNWGMPYAMPGLTSEEEIIILSWLQQGAKFERLPPLSHTIKETITQWENYFNRTSLKQKLVSRYIYEHLFIGHLHFKDHSDNEFFRMVRSTTPSGQPIQEIATLLPYNEPGVDRFYYRLRRIEETIVEKTHFIYELSQKKMQRFNELFFKPAYNVTYLPSYKPEISSNPFLAFDQIPYNLRYKFLLDNAQYFVSGFIKGPICRGQIALGVIRDRFWIAFFKPVEKTDEPDKAQLLTDFLATQTMTPRLPGTAGDKLGLLGFKKYDALAKQYLENKETFANQFISQFGGLTMAHLWDGDGTNKNALLTIFRHFDSATVVKGLVGETPLTALVLDYPLFERIHYSLVAGFDVYSSVEHQLASRKYMDFLRMDGENNFLRFIPKAHRKKMHKSWYKGLSGKLANYLSTPYYSADYETGVTYKTQYYKKEFFKQLKEKLGKAAINKQSISVENARPHITETIKKLSALKGEKLDVFPEMSLIRIRTSQKDNDRVYTILLNKALKNVAFMVGENLRRERKHDTLTIVPGFLGSYPNFFFNVPEEQLSDFISSIENIKNKKDKDDFYIKFGIRRTNPDIWQYVDWFNSQHKKYRGVRAGLFDLNRYHNL